MEVCFGMPNCNTQVHLWEHVLCQLIRTHLQHAGELSIRSVVNVIKFSFVKFTPPEHGRFNVNNASERLNSYYFMYF